jgi:hypothetical protein
MGNLFSSKPSSPAPPPPAPAVDDKAAKARDAAARDEQIRRQQAGLASTILTSGDDGAGLSSKKVLLGVK